VVLFGLIAATGGRIWVQNRMDFSNSRNLVTAAVTLTIGAPRQVPWIEPPSRNPVAAARFRLYQPA